jgi:hypothetical protein
MSIVELEQGVAGVAEIEIVTLRDRYLLGY